jgi:hypothetical protein
MKRNTLINIIGTATPVILGVTSIVLVILFKS